MSQRLNSLTVNGTQLHYQEAGKGDLVVLVHGTLGDYRTWRRQLVAFSQKYHVVSYSRRLHFPNERTAVEYSVEIHAEDLAHLITHFGSKAHLVTASWGGNVALQLALTHPSLVRTIVLAEPPTLPLLANNPATKHLLEEFYRDSWIPARKLLLNDEFERGIKSFLDGVLGPGVYDMIPLRARRYFLDNAHELKAEALSTNYIPDFTPERIRSIQHPVLLLEGDCSPNFFHAILDILQSSLLRTDRRKISNASHGMHADNPTEYNRYVLDFLSRH